MAQGFESPILRNGDSDSDWIAIDRADASHSPGAAEAGSSVLLRQVLQRFHTMSRNLEQNIRNIYAATTSDQEIATFAQPAASKSLELSLQQNARRGLQNSLEEANAKSSRLLDENQAIKALMENSNQAVRFKEEQAKQLLANLQDQLHVVEALLHDETACVHALQRQLEVANSRIAELELQVEEGVQLRRCSEHGVEVGERLERAREELRLEKAASEVLRADLTFAEEASVFLRADFEKTRSQLSLAQAEAKKLVLEVEALTQDNAELLMEMEQAGQAYTTQQHQLNNLEQQLANASANAVAAAASATEQANEVQLLQRQLTAATADAVATAEAHQRALLQLRQQQQQEAANVPATEAQPHVSLVTSSNDQAVITEAAQQQSSNDSSNRQLPPEKKLRTCDAAVASSAGPSRSNSRQSLAGTGCVSKATTGAGTAKGQTQARVKENGPSSRTKLAVLRKEMNILEAHSHALRNELVVVQNQFDALLSVVRSTAMQQIQESQWIRETSGREHSVMANEERKAYALLAMIQDPSLNVHLVEAHAAKERVRLLQEAHVHKAMPTPALSAQVTAVLMSMALGEQSAHTQPELTCSHPGVDVASTFYHADGSEQYPINAQHPYLEYQNGKGLSRADMPHVPESTSDHHHPPTETCSTSSAAFLELHSMFTLPSPDNSHLLHSPRHTTHRQQEQGITQDIYDNPSISHASADQHLSPVPRSKPSRSSVYAGQAFIVHHQAQQLPCPQNRDGGSAAAEDTAQSAGDEWNLVSSAFGAYEAGLTFGALRRLPTAEDSAVSTGSGWESETSQLGSFGAGGEQKLQVSALEDDPFTLGDQYQFPPPAPPPDFGGWKP